MSNTESCKVCVGMRVRRGFKPDSQSYYCKRHDRKTSITRTRLYTEQGVQEAIQAAKVELLEELREAMVVQQNNPWGIKLINTELSKLRSEK